MTRIEIGIIKMLTFYTTLNNTLWRAPLSILERAITVNRNLFFWKTVLRERVYNFELKVALAARSMNVKDFLIRKLIPFTSEFWSTLQVILISFIVVTAVWLYIATQNILKYRKMIGIFVPCLQYFYFWNIFVLSTVLLKIPRCRLIFK